MAKGHLFRAFLIRDIVLFRVVNEIVDKRISPENQDKSRLESQRVPRFSFRAKTNSHPVQDQHPFQVPTHRSAILQSQGKVIWRILTKYE